MQLDILNQKLNANTELPALRRLYGGKPEELQRQKKRYLQLIQQFRMHFPDHGAAEIFSSPGRTEVCGNHTDHNAGRVLAAAVNLDVLTVAAPSSDNVIRIASHGYPEIVVNTDNLQIIEREKYTSTALVRGICARMRELGYTVSGFHATMTSMVPNGSGLSSSAAFEMMIVAILNHLYNQGQIDPILAAQIGQYSENNYFGKPCGLMDQTTCAYGGFVMIDFQDFSNPVVHQVDYDFSASGYTLAIVGTGGSHADLNDDYAALEQEMKSVAHVFGRQVLREISKETVLENIGKLRGSTS
jgi:galactokinase